MKSAILFMIFKREDTTRRVFERIREAQPPRLYIAADGPRKDRPDEMDKCKATRKVVESIDWPCEVHYLYREVNLGCGRGVSSAITWFFEHEEQGIIIEDDILPHVDFFLYCDEMLERYKDDERIQLISGRNAFYNGYEAPFSYYMSNLFHIWGWATWRRVWETYEFDTNNISSEKFTLNMSKRSLPKMTKRYWLKIFRQMCDNPIDTWDYQLYFNEIVYQRYSIIPYGNITENIGFDMDDATHTKGANIKESIHSSSSPYPIRHPQDLLEDIEADAVFAENFGFVDCSLLEHYILKIKRLFI